MKNQPKVKFFNGLIEKAGSADNADGLFTLYNTATKDRDGDTIAEDGFDLTQFKRNSVALFMHDHQKPIGTWSDIKMEGARLVAKLHLGQTNLAKMVRQLISEGTLKAVSVGFLPKSYDAQYDDKDRFVGYHFTSVELIEASLVSVPSHPDALLMAKSYGLSDTEQKLFFNTTLAAVEEKTREKTDLRASLDATLNRITEIL
ncbi:MAG: HK97 family phage prohead protease [Deltaproteobacteria bacterium]|nr:HK97 family phage prohead protease [Deltaproteobacteria bacterium]